ncbi:hypothetical protein OIO90_000830 [Microbotryomycetes sp. JL221]|nr:hypothetical protein OIO90_000830 [Microbotryomycetes sp. JL221]
MVQFALLIALCAWSSITLASPIFVLPRDSRTGTEQYYDSPWHQPQFNRIVSFGDSFSDAGNGAWLASNKTWPADKNYVGHRFSNGPVWIENAAKILRLPLQSYATGGATTDNRLVQGYTGFNSTIKVRSVFDQVELFLASKPKGVKSTLFVIEGGGNDAFFGLPNVTASQSVAGLVKATKKLEAQGAKYILLPTLPPLAPHYPFAAQSPSYIEPLADFSTQFRRDMLQAVNATKARAYVDLYTTYSRVLAQPRQFGFDPALIDQNCLVGVYSGEGRVTVCKNPREHIWWDEYHPTTSMHAISGYAAVQALKRVGWV